MNQSTRLPLEEIVTIMTKRVAALKAAQPDHSHEVGNHKHALMGAIDTLESAEAALRRKQR